MTYVTKNGIVINDDDLVNAKILAHLRCGHRYFFGLSEFRKICLHKGRIKNNEFRYIDPFSVTPCYHNAVIFNNFVEAYNNTGIFGCRLDRFSEACELFFKHENEIFGDPDMPRFFSASGSVFSDTEILVSFEILQGKRKHKIDEEVLAFINEIPGLQEIDQEYITFDFLLSKEDYFRSVKRAMRSMSKEEAIKRVAAYFFDENFDEDPDEFFDADFF